MEVLKPKKLTSRQRLKKLIKEYPKITKLVRDYSKKVLQIKLLAIQAEIAIALLVYKRVICVAPVSIGKSFCAAFVANLFTDLYPPSNVEKTITMIFDVSEKHLKYNLMPMVNNMRDNVDLKGERHTYDIHLQKNWKIFAICPAIHSGKFGRARGYHATNQCIIADEASDLDNRLITTIDELITTGKNCNVLFITNPIEDPEISCPEFYKLATSKNDYYKINVTPYDIPTIRLKKTLPWIPDLVQYEWYVRMSKKYKNKNSINYKLRVLGEWVSTIKQRYGAVIDIKNIENSPNTTIHSSYMDPIIISVDPASGGSCDTAIAVFHGTVLIDLLVMNVKDARDSIGKVMEIYSNYSSVGHKVLVVYDAAGTAGFGDLIRLTYMKYISFLGKERAIRSRLFINKRVEAWHVASKMLALNKVKLIKDKELFRQLSAPIAIYNENTGKISLEAKKDLFKRGYKKLDKADAVVMGLYIYHIRYAYNKSILYKIESYNNK